MDVVSNFTTLPSIYGDGRALVVLNGVVLDVTLYLETVTNVVEVSDGIYSRAFALDRMFLPLDLTQMLFINLGQDISDQFEANIANAGIYEQCMKTLFYAGITEELAPTGCLKINPALWATMGVGLLYFLIKMNLAHLCRLRFMQRLLFSSTPPEFSSAIRNAGWPYTILMIPCYAEPSETLKQAFDSLARTNYDDSKKLLLFVCDGLVRSAHDSKETYLCILESLGYSGTEDPVSQPYASLGMNRKKINYAKVYSGFYETGRNRVPYLVVVKVGSPKEAASLEVVPGNRGKRDSLVLVFSFLERCMNLANNRMTPLEYELFNQFYNVLGIDPRKFKYMLVMDADTQVQGDALQKMVSRLEKDRKMLAISGHVRPANPEQNITTMLQIFPLYLTFYSGLAYEAFLGTVLSINGGFMMYKLWTEVMAAEEQQITVAQELNNNSVSQQTIRALSKWPKVSDEIIINPYADDRSSSSDGGGGRDTMATGRESRLSLAPNSRIRPCCIHPTVLRGFATPRPDTLHMQNVLLLGEEQYLGIVLLRSHPHHRLGFEPEAIGYAMLPTNIFALQALQSRNLRAAFHNQIEMHRVAWNLGVACWILSFSKLLDMIFSVPIIIYLYGVYIRFFIGRGLAYTIIAISFTALVVLHILYFIVRRQFKYVLWFIIYGLFGVPLFAVWFPLVAAWCSDYAERWYDVWPTANNKGRRGRLHGAVDNNNKSPRSEEDVYEQKSTTEVEEEDLLPRLRFAEFEAAEMEKSYQRAMEEAAALDSNFTGFTTGFVSGRGRRANSVQSSFGEQMIPSPPMAAAQLRRYPMRGRGDSNPTIGYNKPSTVRLPQEHGERSIEISTASSTKAPTTIENPFASELDNPFHDSYAVQQPPYIPEHTLRNFRQTGNNKQQQHKPSHSQSSYFTYSSRNTTTNDEYSSYYAPSSTAVAGGGRETSAAAAGTTRTVPRGRSYSTDSVVPIDRCSIHSATYSLASSNLSVDLEASLERARYGGLYNSNGRIEEGEENNEEGRNAALHSRIGLKIPGHAGMRGFGRYGKGRNI